MRHKEQIEQIFNIKSDAAFNRLCLEVFQDQFNRIPIYRAYCELLNKSPEHVFTIEDIPFLPISVFKNHEVIPPGSKPDLIFKSSGTSDLSLRSTHYVLDKAIYEQSLFKTFEHFFGDPEQYIMCSLLPGYIDNPNSSLIYMVNALSKKSADSSLHHFPSDPEMLISSILNWNKNGQKTFLFGVSFALLDLAEKFQLNLNHTTILETGGMKGRRKEITREEMHQYITNKLNPEKIVSEYGMTELLSQAYAINNGLFECPAWMKVLLRDVQDPLTILSEGSGAINIIDLANIHSCAFLATDDLGRLEKNGLFEVLGRFDHSDIRGCNLLYDGQN